MFCYLDPVKTIYTSFDLYKCTSKGYCFLFVIYHICSRLTYLAISPARIMLCSERRITSD